MPVRRLNHAVLYVRNVARAVEFYTDVFGFRLDVDIPGRAAFLSAEGTLNDHDLGLFSVGPEAPGPEQGRVGLYHLAWEVGTLGELVEIADKINERGAMVGSTNHGVSKSVYAKDPDGNEFEIMWRVPREDWPSATDENRSGALDLEESLKRWGPDLKTGAAAGSAT
ncbi:VOC family protein [Streptomyces sp. CBMA152]|uniref:VOC family protein n=1 Tax=Streptomyces sp. CBMA152 TaxID=1896312 RepID=UPI0016616C6F|nr:VOC family protein [Streptomyces sp. CBMA152]MBD0744000.1 glyoxalase [Streptomyces sp. CBMA152]